MSTKVFNLLTRLNSIAPVLCIVAVLSFTAWLRHDPARVPVFGPEQAAVARAVDSAPYRIGEWVGVDAPVPEAAVRLLRPNAMLSRRYENLESGVSIDLVIVHCGDARDMLGHYPPVCYPNAGWVPLENTKRSTRKQTGRPVVLNMHGHEVPASMYEFARMQDWSRESRIRIFNFFILPDGNVSHDIADVRDGTRWLGASIHGVAQVQLITDQSVQIELAEGAASEILEGMKQVMDSLGVFQDD